MLPYFRSMEAFVNLTLPKSWADLSDHQHLLFSYYGFNSIRLNPDFGHGYGLRFTKKMGRISLKDLDLVRNISLIDCS